MYLDTSRHQSRARAGPGELSSTHTKLCKRLTTTHTVTLYDQASHLSIIFLACFLLSDWVSGQLFEGED